MIVIHSDCYVCSPSSRLDQTDLLWTISINHWDPWIAFICWGLWETLNTPTVCYIAVLNIWREKNFKECKVHRRKMANWAKETKTRDAALLNRTEIRNKKLFFFNNTAQRLGGEMKICAAGGIWQRERRWKRGKRWMNLHIPEANLFTRTNIQIHNLKAR